MTKDELIEALAPFAGSDIIAFRVKKNGLWAFPVDDEVTPAKLNDFRGDGYLTHAVILDIGAEGMRVES